MGGHQRRNEKHGREVAGEEKEEKEQAMDDIGNPEVDRDEKKSEAREG